MKSKFEFNKNDGGCSDVKIGDITLDKFVDSNQYTIQCCIQQVV